MVKTLASNAGVVGSIPVGELRSHMPHWPKNQNIKQKQYCNKFSKDLKKRKKVHIMSFSRMQFWILQPVTYIEEVLSES